MDQDQAVTGYARYIAIANDLATRIAHEEYREGERLLGRSSLAARYSVSPETIRRAVSFLEEIGIVRVLPGIGVVVKSKEAAKAYLAQVEENKDMQKIQNRLNILLQERTRLEIEIKQLLDELLNHTYKASMRFQKINEFCVPPGSPLVGQTLASSEFRVRTGATVLSIQSNGETIFSPPAETVIKSGDVLVFISSTELLDRVHDAINHGSP